MIIVKESQIQLGHLKWSKIKEIIHRGFVPTGQTTIGAYIEVLKRLMARIRPIRFEYCDPETWSLLHLNHCWIAVTSVLKLEEKILNKRIEKYSDILFQWCFPRPVSKIICRTVYYFFILYHFRYPVNYSKVGRTI